ncbi:response regulator transcription factor [Cytobacillus sp. Hm23]|uniref:response regulator transcription factor n=1 Tax=Cytobacillus sp. IB215665 TaxID=3097357 RepID=UPI002A169686|nr:response regulator transcription factor [Cytobacillus sp. IB215665]MDX8365903.1 response regulator transcription factor [Cytobacillus sp. IB215665]
MSYSIYLVEDEMNLNQILSTYLQNEGWHVKSFHTGLDAKNSIKDQPNLWILDIMLPDIDGYELIKAIKEHDEQTPVIFISARDEDLDRIIGLELGSDDYLAKPFLPKELVIRAKKLLTRVYGKQTVHNAIHYGNYVINEEKRTVHKENEEVVLSSKEFDLLLLFVKNIGQAFSREQVLDYIWGSDYFGSDRVVDDLVRRVRKKVTELRVETLYGFGYRTVEAT